MFVANAHKRTKGFMKLAVHDKLFNELEILHKAVKAATDDKLKDVFKV